MVAAVCVCMYMCVVTLHVCIHGHKRDFVASCLVVERDTGHKASNSLCATVTL